MNHLDNIAERLPDRNVEALLITSESNEYYAVGFHGEGLVLITTRGCFYYTDSRYTEAAAEAVTGCAVTTLSPGTTHLGLAACQVHALGITRLGFEEEAVSVAEHQRMQTAFGSEVSFIGCSALLRELRAAKDEGEIAVMRRAQDITDRAFEQILGYLKPGVTESEIAARLTYLMQAMGAQRNSFDPIVASGPNGSRPHAIPGPRQIQSGELVTMDFGCVFEGYCSDMTRTVAVGEPTPDMRRAYETVLEAQLTGISMARAGVIGADVHNAAVAVLDKAGFAGKMGHGFGHSLGIDIHEDPGFRPATKSPMPAGAVVSTEPGIYLPGQFGIRIEDVVVLREGCCEILTQSPKTELIVL